MKGKKYTTEEKIRILRQADRGKSIQEVCRENNVSEQTYHRWKREFGMIDVNQAKRMKALEMENTRLKRILADKLLGIEILQETLEKNGRCRSHSVVSPGHKRQVVERLVARCQCSMRAACRYFHLHRCTYAYRSKYPDGWQTKLKVAVRRLSRQYARWGYAKITKLLKD